MNKYVILIGFLVLVIGILADAYNTKGVGLVVMFAGIFCSAITIKRD